MRTKRLEGWGEIATALAGAAGVTVSIDQAKRYASNHGLPVMRTGPGAVKRVVAELSAVTDWCIANFG